MIRDFVLSNAQGQKIDILDLNMFGHEPEGLGLSLDHELINQGASFINISTTQAVENFKIKLLIGATSLPGYNAYSVLAQFLHYAPFQLEYSTDAGVYKRDCVLESITKTEITQGLTALDEELNMTFVSPWYQEIEITTTPGDNGPGTIGLFGMIYINEVINISRAKVILYGGSYFNRPPEAKYPIYFGGDDKKYGNLKIDNKTMNPLSNGSPVKVIIEGVTDNPYWEVVQNSNIIDSDGYQIMTREGDTIEVSSYPNDQKAQWITDDGVINNLYLSQDISRSGFIRFPPGESTISFTGVEGKIKVIYREERLLV